MRRIMFLVPLWLIGGCIEAHDPANDRMELFERALVAAKKQFGAGHCVVRQLAKSPFELPEKTRRKWSTVEIDGQRVDFREIDSPPIGRIPDKFLSGFTVTDQRYGCSQTLQFYEPEFMEIRMKGFNRYEVTVSVDDLCGPNCGGMRTLTFVRRDDVWVMDEEKFGDTMIDY